MGDKLTEQEIQAIAAYAARGGIVHHCPDGAAMNAIGAEHGEITTFTDWLAEHGLSVTPIRPDQKPKPNRVQEIIDARGYSVDAYLDKAA